MEVFVQGFPVFLLIFCRITSFFVVAPVFSTRTVPTTFKIGFCFMLSIIVFMTYGLKQTVVPDASFILAIIREILAGVLLGFTAYLFFAAIQTAGGFMDLQIGFGIADVIDPMTGASSPLIANLKFMMATLIFLSVNGHHFLIMALLDSYEWIPLSNSLFSHIYNGNISTFLVHTFAETFMLALQMSAPIVVAMFLADVGLGFLARTAPQYNVFVIGIPLKIIIGLLMLVILLPGMLAIFEHLFSQLFAAIQELLGIIRNPAT
ncbi:flagellar biosynthetic protein FliR [Paenibacillus sepulcri]|uniref:Flagellar biosynthetic protein FliR n=1 Tax=Paenibacillus sepulcri TaxID=359917 RepID=A0ABS7C0Q9_9BACL|nr:flagellar type III secretion system protein FliR [Paenibacillus sepulcri]